MTDPRRFPCVTLTLIFAAFLVYLVGNAEVPLWDRDEPRYAQASRQMLATGDWVMPMYLDDLRIQKPPLIYWLQSASMNVFGVNAFAARFPSAVAMALTLLVLSVVVRRALGPEHAFWTVLVLASNALVVVAAKACLTDAVLLLFLTCMQLAVYRMVVHRASWPTVMVFAVSLGLALLTKGPVALGIPATTLAAYAVLSWWTRRQTIAATPAPGTAGEGGGEGQTEDGQPEPVTDERRQRSSRLTVVAKALVAVAIVVAVCLPWVIAIEKRWAQLPPEVRVTVMHGSGRKAVEPRPTDVVGGYVWNVIDKEVLHRSTTAQEGHKGPPGYYLAAIWGIFMPWSLVLPATVVVAWKRRREPHVRFALAALFGPWVMFEAVQTKLPHYLLPCFVPLAVLTADLIVQCLRHGSNALANGHFQRGVVVWAVLLGLAGLAPWVLTRQFGSSPAGPLVLLNLVVIAYAVWVARLFFKYETQRALVALGVGGLLVYAITFRIFLPTRDYLKLAPTVADVLREQGATDPGEVLMLDYKEPSLAFYQGGTIREHSATVLSKKLLELTQPVQWYVITKEVWEKSTEAQPMLDVVSTTRGLDVADGMRTVEVMVVRRRPATVG